MAGRCEIWRGINLKNLEENILPTRQRARLILRKAANHHVDSGRAAQALGSLRQSTIKPRQKKAAWGGGLTSNAL